MTERGRAATKNENYLTTKNAKNTKKFSPPATGENERGGKICAGHENSQR
jgi:hypothetical protein